MKDIQNPKISVILPVYNGVKTLKETLYSIINQSFKDFELICCIDGSNDGSEDLIKSFESDFKELTILRNEKNLGLGLTMNRLMSAARGEYIAVAEQDDYYYPDRFELQCNVLEKNKDIGMVSAISEFWDGEKIVFKFPGILLSGKQYPRGTEMFLLNYRNQIKVVNSCMMLRKSVHINNGLYFSKHYPSISVDWSYVLRFSMVSSIHGIHKPLVRLDRRVERSSVTSNKTKQFLATRELLKSFRYEYSDVITNKDYNYALNTQRIMEMNHLPFSKYMIRFVINVIKNPSDQRFYKSLQKKIKNKFLKNR